MLDLAGVMKRPGLVKDRVVALNLTKEADDMQPLVTIVEGYIRDPYTRAELPFLLKLVTELPEDDLGAFVVLGRLEVLLVHEQALDESEQKLQKPSSSIYEASVEDANEILLAGIVGQKLDAVKNQ